MAENQRSTLITNKAISRWCR